MLLTENASAHGATHGYDNYQRMAFFTDTSVCIGCKACEVACKEWNRNPVEGYEVTGDSYDNTGALGANTWRHVRLWSRTTTALSSPVRRARS